MSEATSGKDTTEYEAAQSGSKWGILATVLGIVVTLGSIVAAAFGESTTAGIVAGTLVALAGIGQKTLVNLGYIKSRTDVKAAASSANATPAGGSANVELPELDK